MASQRYSPLKCLVSSPKTLINLDRPYTSVKISIKHINIFENVPCCWVSVEVTRGYEG